jgi:sugar/nucleoside kinase (ribokinase family)
VAPRLIVIGDCNPDLVLSGNVRPRFGQAETVVGDAELTVGGSAAITACAAVRLGLDCTLIAAIGDDALGRTQAEALSAAGVDLSGLSVDPEHATGVTVVLAETADRAILTAPGAIARLNRAAVDEAVLATADHVHVSAWFLLEDLRPALPSLLRTARAAGATVSLDTNFDPAGRWLSDELELALGEVDLLLPNLAEARALSGEADPLAAARALARRVPAVAVKLGADGAVVVAGNDTAAAAPPAVEVIDTTGAGDNFNAGFIVGRLGGRSLADSLRLAIACGALSTGALGGASAQPNLERASAFAASISLCD